jgi:4-hydroxyphenylpyruvate dioxygenase
MAPIALATAPTASHPLSAALHEEPVSTTGTTKAQKTGSYQGYDNVHWYVGNAKQAASFYITRMGFKKVAYRGLETGSRVVASHVVRNGDVTFIFTSPLQSTVTSNTAISKEDKELLNEIHKHLDTHGDAVRDVAFRVDDVHSVYNAAVQNGAHPVFAPEVLSDEFGTVVYARIRTYGDTSKSYRHHGKASH